MTERSFRPLKRILFLFMKQKQSLSEMNNSYFRPLKRILFLFKEKRIKEEYFNSIKFSSPKEDSFFIQVSWHACMKMANCMCLRPLMGILFYSRLISKYGILSIEIQIKTPNADSFLILAT